MAVWGIWWSHHNSCQRHCLDSWRRWYSVWQVRMVLSGKDLNWKPRATCETFSFVFRETIRASCLAISTQTLALVITQRWAKWGNGITRQTQTFSKVNAAHFQARLVNFSHLASQRIKLWSCFHQKCVEAFYLTLRRKETFMVWRHSSSVEVIERLITARCTLRMNVTVVASAFLRVCSTSLRADSERQSLCRSHISTMLTLFTMNKSMEWSQTRTSTSFQFHLNP